MSPRTMFTILFVCSIVITMAFCIWKVILAFTPEEKSPTGKVLIGTHQLRKIDAGWNDEKAYLVVTPGTINFSWLANDGKTWIDSSLLFEQVRFAPNGNDYKKPTIRFRWERSDYTDPVLIMLHQIEYAIISLNTSDWPVLYGAKRK